MKTKKSLVLFLISCLILSSLLCLGVAAEDGESAGIFGKMSTGAIVSLCIGAALIVLIVVLCIVKRQKVSESLRAYRSEMKKITWYPFKQTCRSTLFVLVVIVATALLVGLLDVAFFSLQDLLVSKL
ncbi:MAG: preprotein translocase subunit SecE [Clostridia bacterium]|nr:preprotein translocase subunit SecE [Clostridia bacterium]